MAARRTIVFSIKVTADCWEDWVRNPNARRCFVEELVQHVEDHATDNHLRITKIQLHNELKDD